MNFWEVPWWERRSQASWMFWHNPHAEVRVTDPRFGRRWYFTHPSPAHTEVLKANGWEFSTGNPPFYRTDSEEVARTSLVSLGLELPDWQTRYCYRVYWFEWTYHI